MERVPESEAIAELEDARRYSAVMGRGLVQYEYRHLARQAAALGVPGSGRVLDVGTGPGFVAIEVARLLQGRDCHVVGLDLSPAMLAMAEENARGAGLQDTLSWQQGDAKAMPFADGEFDLVVSSGSLHHWEDPLVVLDEIARVLREGGGYLIRDSKRLAGGWSRLLAWAIGMTVPPDFRRHYWGSIRSSYSAVELRVILERSRLVGWRIVEDGLDLMVIKEA
jgi:ubiquinone/menaquinone biosynthesis C-methylase UbiE